VYAVCDCVPTNRGQAALGQLRPLHCIHPQIRPWRGAQPPPSSLQFLFASVHNLTSFWAFREPMAVRQGPM
jgi:hypothetical protein